MSLYVAPWCRIFLPPLHDSTAKSPCINPVLQQLPTALEARRSAVEQKRVVETCIMKSSPTSHVILLSAKHKLLMTLLQTPKLTQLHHKDNASPTFPPALCATRQPTNTHLTLPQHHPTTLQPSYSHQARRPNGQCLQPKSYSSQGTRKGIRRYVFT